MDGFRLGVHLADRSGRRSEERDREFRGMLATAEVPSIRFHELRHTAATLLLAQGVDPRTIMETLGHSQISLTMNTYSHVLPALQEAAAAKMDAIDRKSTRLNSSHGYISYAVFCLKKKKKPTHLTTK